MRQISTLGRRRGDKELFDLNYTPFMVKAFHERELIPSMIAFRCGCGCDIRKPDVRAAGLRHDDSRVKYGWITSPGSRPEYQPAGRLELSAQFPGFGSNTSWRQIPLEPEISNSPCKFYLRVVMFFITAG
jgi:hypothetical protein